MTESKVINQHHDNEEEQFPIVDEQGNILGAISRGHAHDGCKILHPVVHLHVFNSRGELYLQHRPAWKDIQPDKWDTACGGHVDLGESVEIALRREVREELGMTDYEPVSMGHYVFESQRRKNWFTFIAASTTDRFVLTRMSWQVDASGAKRRSARIWERISLLPTLRMNTNASS